MFSIYKIINTINDLVYIGFTSKSPASRWNDHKAVSRNPTRHDHQLLHRAMRKHGIDKFKFEVIYQSKDSDHCVNEMEPYFIAHYNSFGDGGYNLTPGGEASMLGRKFTEEHKAAIAAALTGKVKPYMQIVNRDPEKIRKTAEKHRGTKRSDETKAKMSAIHKGKVISEEQKVKLSKTWIVVFPDGHEQTVVNLNAFCKEHGLDVGNLSNVAYGRAKSHKGFRCRKSE
jgi:group I intron endonuclease